MCVEVVFVLFKQNFEERYPEHKGNMKLASGYPSDIIPGKLSDVDISFLIDDHANLEHIFPKELFTKDTKFPQRTIYTRIFRGREVNVFCTNDKKLYMKGVILRRNQHMLAINFPLLTAKVKKYKAMGSINDIPVSTTYAWVKALELKINHPYEAYDIMMHNYYNIGKRREEALKKIIPII